MWPNQLVYNNPVIFIIIFILQIKKQRLWNLSKVIESKSGRAVIQNQFCLLLELMLFFFLNFKLYYFFKFRLHQVFTQASLVVVLRLRCPVACGILVPQPGLNSCPSHWKVDSKTLDHQGNPQSSCFDLCNQGCATVKDLALIFIINLDHSMVFPCLCSFYLEEKKRQLFLRGGLACLVIVFHTD